MADEGAGKADPAPRVASAAPSAKADDEPVAVAPVAKPAEPKPAPNAKPEPEPEPEPEPVTIESGESKFPAGTALFRRADGTGEPIRGIDLRDSGAMAKRLDAKVVTRTGAMNFSIGGKLAFRKSADDEKTVSVRISSPEVVTSDGVRLGMKYVELLAKVPDSKCTLEGGADGSIVACNLAHGVVAEFESKDPKFFDYTGEEEDFDMAKVIGRAEVRSLIARFRDVPAPVSPVALADNPERGVLPASLTWRDYSICGEDDRPKRCVDPVAAVIDGVYDEAEARKRLQALSSEGLAFGYPMVVHSDELGLEDASLGGVVLVLGLFASSSAAEHWRDEGHKSAKVHGLLRTSALHERQSGKKRAQEYIVARVRPGNPVPAYGVGDLSPTTQKAVARKAVCEIPGGTFALVDKDVLDETYYQSLPMTCPDGTGAFVRWDDTLMMSVLGERADGSPGYWQVVEVECDQPQHARWAVDNDGRRSGKPKLLPNEGC